jgi:hypothetical protein
MKTREFNVCMTIPTGVGCEIGGHAGDAGPAAKLLAATCDNLILHPNVVNASDINEMPPNALYVEGSTIDRWLAGQIELQPVRSNRILVIAQEHPTNAEITNLVEDTANAARATWGARIAKVIRLDDPPELKGFYDVQGMATAVMDNLTPLADVLNGERPNYDAVAIATIIDLPADYHKRYFAGELPINPWGGPEAVLTHWMSSTFNVPCAHAPMLESWEAIEFTTDHLDPRMAAEAISCGFIHCVLKGLHKAPRITATLNHPLNISRADTVLVVPRNCNGPAVTAARQAGLTVIEVVDNTNLCAHDLRKYDWKPDQHVRVTDYFAAAGALLALREGMDPKTCSRPLLPALVEDR